MAEDSHPILAKLIAIGGDVLQTRVGAWMREIRVKRPAVEGVDGWLSFEFDVPRLGSRIEVVLLFGQHLVPFEFKVEQDEYLRPDIDEAWDYADSTRKPGFYDDTFVYLRRVGKEVI